jgi:hypothetical protein
VEGREKELSKPIIQLFYGSKGTKRGRDDITELLESKN